MTLELINFKDALAHFQDAPEWATNRKKISHAEIELGYCLDSNPGPFTMNDVIGAVVTKTDATYPVGMGDYDWEWIVTLDDGRVYKVVAWHDFTGWDCASSATYTELGVK